MSERDYQQLIDDLSDARLAASEIDLKSDRVKKGSARQLMNEILSDGSSEE